MPCWPSWPPPKAAAWSTTTRPNAPAGGGFDLIIAAAAGSALGNSGAPYTLTISAIDLTAVSQPWPPQILHQAFNAASGWKLSGTGPDYQCTQTIPHTILGGPGGPLAGHARIVRAARRTCPPGGQVLAPGDIPDEQAVLADDELLRLERHAALREALASLPPPCGRLIALLAQDPPLPYAQISALLGIPVGSIGPTRSRCLAKLRRHPAIAALASAGPATMTDEPPAHAVTS